MSNQTHHLFAYGTLMIPAMIHRLLGREIGACLGTLNGYACYEVKHQIYPAIVAVRGSIVSGVVYQRLTDEDLERLDEYEGEMYERTLVEIELSTGDYIPCETYVCKSEYIDLLDDSIWTSSRISPEGLEGLIS